MSTDHHSRPQTDEVVRGLVEELMILEPVGPRCTRVEVIVRVDARGNVPAMVLKRTLAHRADYMTEYQEVFWNDEPLPMPEAIL